MILSVFEQCKNNTIQRSLGREGDKKQVKIIIHRWRQSEKQQVRQEEGKQGKSEYYQIKTGSFHVSVINTDNPTKETRQRGQRETLGTLDAQQRNNKS